MTSFRGLFVSFDPESLKPVLDDLALAAEVEFCFGTTVPSAEREENRLTSIAIAHHGGVETCEGRAFVDCTGDRDLAAFGRASKRYDNPGGVNPGTLGCRFGRIPAGIPVTVEDVADAVGALDVPTGTVT